MKRWIGGQCQHGTDRFGRILAGRSDQFVERGQRDGNLRTAHNLAVPDGNEGMAAARVACVLEAETLGQAQGMGIGAPPRRGVEKDVRQTVFGIQW